MTNNSFNFGNKNSYTQWGLKCNAYDFLLPQKRARKLLIPGKDGMYDYGARNYEERILRLECVLTRPLPKYLMREMAYTLSKKNKITLWDEPHLFYIGALYDAVDGIDPTSDTLRTFELAFVCDPYAYSEKKTLDIATGKNRMEYKGTAETPTMIVLRNNNPYPVTNIILTLTKRRDDSIVSP